jgi:hypothetical protein
MLSNDACAMICLYVRAASSGLSASSFDADLMSDEISVHEVNGMQRFATSAMHRNFRRCCSTIAVDVDARWQRMNEKDEERGYSFELT